MKMKIKVETGYSFFCENCKKYFLGNSISILKECPCCKKASFLNFWDFNKEANEEISNKPILKEVALDEKIDNSEYLAFYLRRVWRD